MRDVAGITVVIPVHTPRVVNGTLRRALNSVWEQTQLPDAVIVQHDWGRHGSYKTRNTAIASVKTEWIAFLDSDDEWLPYHLHEVFKCARETGADVIYPGCYVMGGTDPHDRFGQEFDPDLLRQKSYIPVTSLVRTSLAVHVGGFCREPGGYDDHCFYLRLLNEGAKFVHHPVKTWLWNVTQQARPGADGNTSGLADGRW